MLVVIHVSWVVWWNEKQQRGVWAGSLGPTAPASEDIVLHWVRGLPLDGAFGRYGYGAYQ